jgi:phytoene dehydrogenase-like protein
VSPPVIVIGAGPDELVIARSLSRAGLPVLVLDRRPAHERASLQGGWILPRVVAELGLERQGLKIHRPDPWLATPLADGGRLELSLDMRRSQEAIRKLSARDASRWPEFCERMAKVAGVLAQLYDAAPPEPLDASLSGLGSLAWTALRVRRLGRQGMEDLLRWLPMSVADLLDEWFESDALKAMLGAAGILHLAQGPRSGGTAFALIHQHAGSAPGVFRPPRSNLQAVLESGMEGAAGVTVRPGVEVVSIEVSNGRVAGVALSNGEALPASVVVSGADPRRTFLQLVDAAWLDPEFLRAVRNIRCRGVVAQATLTLERNFDMPPLALAPSLEYLERAYEDAKYGQVSRDPYLEAHAEDGRRLVVHVQYAPYRLAQGDWSRRHREALGGRVVELLAGQVPQLAGAITDISVRTPRDLEHAKHWPEGQAHHAELALDQVLWMRPVARWARYRTPVKGLYLCGPGTHPGGGVLGASGLHCAKVLLRDARHGSL